MQNEKAKKIRTKLTQQEKDVLEQAFNLFDSDHSGQIEDKELRDIMKALGLQKILISKGFETSKKEVQKMIAGIDKDGSGTIDL